ncbi:MAG: hypothetical protein J7539_06965 [Niabella sp.]|nr:hypothetical protein [Niabella sp.]
MKYLTILFAFGIIIPFTASAQANRSRSPFRKTYIGIGLSFVGHSLDNSLSPEGNILKGNFGAGTGAAFETGKNFYFLKRSQGKKINVGLDWTMLSASYNSVKKSWTSYANTAGQPNATIAAPVVLSLATKLGPVLSINPVEQLVIDIRAQVVAGIRGIALQYNEQNRGFNAYNNRVDQSSSGNGVSDIFKSSFGVKPGFGATVRRGIAGLSFDYSPGNQTMDYTTAGTNSTSITAKSASIPFDIKQLKLSLLF